MIFFLYIMSFKKYKNFKTNTNIPFKFFILQSENFEINIRDTGN